MRWTRLIEDALIQEKADELGDHSHQGRGGATINDDLQRAAAPPTQETITGTEQIPTPVPQSELDQIYKNVLNNIGLSDKAI